MKKSRFTTWQIIGSIKQADAGMAVDKLSLGWNSGAVSGSVTEIRSFLNFLVPAQHVP